MRGEDIHGYDVEFIEDPPFDVLCAICQCTFKKPTQINPCGHIFCKECIKKLMNSDGNNKRCCPICNGDIQNTFPDKNMERMVLNLKVKCLNSSKGCVWIDELRQLEEHEENCDKHSQQCINECGKTIVRDRMESHLDEECENHPCKYFKIGCQVKGTRSCLEEHEETATKKHLSQAVDKLEILTQKFDYLYSLKWRGISQLPTTFTFSIKNFEEKFKTARQHNDVLYSDHFYCLDGYRVQLFIYLNGYGDSRGTHVSAYFRIMNGPFNDVLDWPFKGIVTFSVEGNAENDIKMEFDTTKPSQRDIDICFQKPKSDRNKGWGFPCYIEHGVIENYIKDNCLATTCYVQHVN